MCLKRRFSGVTQATYQRSPLMASPFQAVFSKIFSSLPLRPEFIPLRLLCRRYLRFWTIVDEVSLAFLSKLESVDISFE